MRRIAKIHWALVTMTGVAVLMVSRASLADIRPVTEKTSPIKIHPGKPFVLSLPALTSAGYRWSVLTSPPFLTYTQSFQAGPKCKKKMVGCPQDQIITLTAHQLGSGSLVLSYGRPWEDRVEHKIELLVTAIP